MQTDQFQFSSRLISFVSQLTFNFVTISSHYNVCDNTRKAVLGVPNCSDTNQPVQSQKKASSLKFQIYEKEEFYLLSLK